MLKRLFPHFSATSLIVPGILLLFIAYFTYYTFYGARGIFTLRKVTHDIALAKEDLKELSTERLSLEHHVKFLRPDHLDQDLLDEQVRRMLNLTNPQEFTIFLENMNNNTSINGSVISGE